ncbi:MAG: hypothetical protein Q8Q31_05145 [Nanoarchaeota archaeon]|nr:hypothetical protein [Nanoarchaeota archaeon]
MLHIFPRVGKEHITIAELSMMDPRIGDVDEKILSPQEISDAFRFQRYSQPQSVSTAPFSRMPFSFFNFVEDRYKVVGEGSISQLSGGVRYYLADVDM